MNQIPLVVDASVAVKWVIDEPNSDQALALLEASSRDRRPLLAPPHMPGEVLNAIYWRWRSRDPTKHLTEANADAALKGFLAIRIQLLSLPGLAEQAYQYCKARTLPSIYDALYVVLARMLGAELWTADQRLLAALGTAALWVQPIAAY